jgi:hypothetical protein
MANYLTLPTRIRQSRLPPYGKADFSSIPTRPLMTQYSSDMEIRTLRNIFWGFPCLLSFFSWARATGLGRGIVIQIQGFVASVHFSHHVYILRDSHRVEPPAMHLSLDSQVRSCIFFFRHVVHIHEALYIVYPRKQCRMRFRTVSSHGHGPITTHIRIPYLHAHAFIVSLAGFEPPLYMYILGFALYYS